MARKLDPKFKEQVTGAYHKGMNSGQSRLSHKEQVRLLADLRKGLNVNSRKAVTAAFELGVMDGEKRHCRQCRNELVSKLTMINAELWRNLNDLDKAEPLEAVMISFAEAEIIISSLRQGVRKVKLANILRRRVQASSHSLHLILAELKTLR